MNAFHGAGHTMPKCFFSTSMPGISVGCDVDSMNISYICYVYYVSVLIGNAVWRI